MNKKISIQLKAAFLLLVFALNTVVGFACAIGVDRSFNAKHHHEEATTPVVHVHSDGKKHIHEKTSKHDYGKKSHHDGEDNDNTKENKDNCCKDQVLKFEQLDKSIANTFAYSSPVFFTDFMTSFYYKGALYSSEDIPKIKYFVRSYHPPISDIRIAIRSFQI